MVTVKNVKQTLKKVPGIKVVGSRNLPAYDGSPMTFILVTQRGGLYEPADFEKQYELLEEALGDMNEGGSGPESERTSSYSSYRGGYVTDGLVRMGNIVIPTEQGDVMIYQTPDSYIGRQLLYLEDMRKNPILNRITLNHLKENREDAKRNPIGRGLRGLLGLDKSRDIVQVHERGW